MLSQKRKTVRKKLCFPTEPHKRPPPKKPTLQKSKKMTSLVNPLFGGGSGDSNGRIKDGVSQNSSNSCAYVFFSSFFFGVWKRSKSTKQPAKHTHINIHSHSPWKGIKTQPTPDFARATAMSVGASVVAATHKSKPKEEKLWAQKAQAHNNKRN